SINSHNPTAMQTLKQKTLLNPLQIDITLKRLCCQLLENHSGFEDSVLIGLQPRGVYFANRVVDLLIDHFGERKVPYGKLDTTFFRDDFRRGEKPLKANSTQIDFLVEDKRVVFIDDVLYTGRSINAALTAIQSFGRPKSVELLTLIDRRFSRHLPIQPDYSGYRVDAIAGSKVKVSWKETDGKDAVLIIHE
ncbi:MAG: bifunctional pyr operon transcriptional regulator/uracil phosphoribosyltransferase PyrR, partial [Flavobacteriaceae bacterium]|nr:bifunctional pyr operon transcriptional regulator/uracil phosphoribosyltransferase PyrR [Flavobacteriaceae bacterium]